MIPWLDGEHGVLIAQTIASCWMCGLIWFVQVVHYPLFDVVRGSEALRYAAEHQRRTTLVVGPPMLVEMVTAAWIVLAPPAFLPVWVAVAGLAMVVLLWVSTAAWQIPYHVKLARDGHDSNVVTGLVRTNRARTALWSARALLSVWMLASV
ncbi:MAG: hypothetical protein AAGA55_08070 [Planctomycetota bacterium]